VSSANRWEGLFGILLGVSVLAWAAAGACSAPASLPRGALGVLQVVVALQLFRRSLCRRHGTWRSSLASVPSVLAGGVAFSAAPPAAAWPIAAQVLFAGGAGLAAVAFLSLARSFAILPALREVVVRGPYRCVRHPGYAGELLMVGACAFAAGGAGGALVIVLAAASLLPRIAAEERVLVASPDYHSYAATVRYRLVPGVW
jgi:protein-S-isoprenylcysteine O-methyltransferase Ste14